MLPTEETGTESDPFPSDETIVVHRYGIQYDGWDVIVHTEGKGTGDPLNQTPVTVAVKKEVDKGEWHGAWCKTSGEPLPLVEIIKSLIKQSKEMSEGMTPPEVEFGTNTEDDKFGAIPGN